MGPSNRKALLRKAGFLLIAVYLAVYIGTIIAQPQKYQWDFKVYYFAAKAITIGLDPYHKPNLEMVAGDEVLQLTLPTFMVPLTIPLSKLKYLHAHLLYLLTRILIMIFLYHIWKRHYFKETDHLLFLPFTLLAFDGAFLWELRTGNIELFCQVMLWLGFLFYIKKRWGLFYLFVAPVAAARISPAIFLLLPFLGKGKKPLKEFLISIVGITGVYSLSFICAKDLFLQFSSIPFDLLSYKSETGIVNPSSLAFLLRFCGIASHKTGLSINGSAAFTLYATCTILILSVSLVTLKSMRSVEGDNFDKKVLFLVCFVLALISPRFKSYTYMLLVVPAFYTIRNLKTVRGFWILFVMILFSRQDFLPGLNLFFGTTKSFPQLTMAFLLWILFVIESFNTTKSPKPVDRESKTSSVINGA